MTRYLEIKPGSISETIKRLSDDYQAIFKKELEKTGKGIGSMTPDEKKAFFNKIDKMHNAKNEVMDSSWIKKEIDKERKTTLVAAPGNKEKVIRIPKEKLADYKAKGYVEAESFVPEQANNPYAIGVAAAMKSTGDTPPLKKSTITKAHKIADKVKEEELTAAQKKLPPALQKAIEKKDKNEEVKMKDDPCWKDYKMIGMKKKNGKEVPNCVPKEEVEIKEGGMKEIDTNKKELERLNIRLSNLRDRKNASAGGDTTDVEKQIKQTQMSVIDLKKKLSTTKTEAVDPERVQKLNQKIANMTTKVGELDKSKPENKTKEAILKSDIATAKLRLQDLMQKSASDVKKAVNEASKAKQSYKSLKMSLKKEQEMNGKKKTLTDKPITKIEVNPKIEG